MFHDLTKSEKRALREAAALAHERDREMSREDRDVHYLQAPNASLPIIVGGALMNGLVRIEEIGESARAMVEDIAARLAAVTTSLEQSPPPPKESYDESAPVSVRGIVAQIEFLIEETALFLNVRTGEVRVIEEEFLPEGDEGDLTDDDRDAAEKKHHEPKWIARAEEHGRRLASDPDWMRFLNSTDLHDRDAMIRFARRSGPAASEELLDALHARRAESRFRDIVRRRGLEQQWDAFRMECLAGTVKWRLKEAGLAFRE